MAQPRLASRAGNSLYMSLSVPGCGGLEEREIAGMDNRSLFSHHEPREGDWWVRDSGQGRQVGKCMAEECGLAWWWLKLQRL